MSRRLSVVIITVVFLASCERSSKSPAEIPTIQTANDVIRTEAIVPSIHAGSDVQGNSSLELKATATDAKDVLWQQLSGPGVLSFADSKALATSVTASADGEYRLKVTATSSTGATASDELTLLWDTTGPAISLTREFKAFQAFDLSASAEGFASAAWEMVSGPGIVTFSSPNTLQSFFSSDIDGIYVIRLTAKDGLGNTSLRDARVIWNTTTPMISAGPDLISKQALVLSATSNSSGSYRWEKVSGPGLVSFDSPTALTTMVSADSEGLYILKISMSNSVGVVTTDELSLEWHMGTFWALPQHTYPYLISDHVTAVAASENMIFAGTYSGLSISKDWGASWVTRTTANGLPSNAIYGLQILGDTVYAATSGGLAFSKDQGASWKHLPKSPTSSDLQTYCVFAVDNKIVVGNYSGVEFSLDGGRTWGMQSRYMNGGIGHIKSVFVKGSKILAAGDDSFSGGVLISLDNGATWISKTKADGLPSNEVHAIYATDNFIFAAAEAGLSVSSDNGTTWVTRIPRTIKAITAVGATLFAATDYDVMYSTDEGVNWTGLFSQNSQKTSIFASDSTILVGMEKGLALSNDKGQRWTFKSAANGFESKYIYGVTTSGDNVYVSGDGGLTMTLDGGSTWTNQTVLNGLGSDIVFETVVIGNSLYAATLKGLSISHDQGKKWINKNISDGLGSDYVRGVYVMGNKILAATAGGISISRDGGVTWSNKSTLHGLLSNSIKDVIIAGGNIYLATAGGLAISTDDGHSWISKTSLHGLGSNELTAIYADGATLYAATSGGLSRSADWGATWINKTTVDGLASNQINAIHAAGGKVYAATNGGLSISSDGGASWVTQQGYSAITQRIVDVTVSGNVLYLASEVGLYYSTDRVNWKCKCPDTSSMRGGFGLNSTVNVAADGRSILVATQNNGFHFSKDGGTNWEKIKAPAGTLDHSYGKGVSISGSTLYLASSAGLLSSTDGGGTWIDRTPSLGLGSANVKALATSESKIFIATDGGLFFSTDSGTSWQNKTTAHGLGANLVRDVYAAGNQIYVATDGGVSISADGGATWVTRTQINGLISKQINGVYGLGSSIYAATPYGLAISADGGMSFVMKDKAAGLSDDFITGVKVSNGKIYASTLAGLSLSSDGGSTWINKDKHDGLGEFGYAGVFIDGNTIYAYGGQLTVLNPLAPIQ